MSIVSVSVPDNLRKSMDKLDEVNWSAVARKAFMEKVEEQMIIEKLARKSKLTRKDANEISDRISREVSKKFRSL